MLGSLLLGSGLLDVGSDVIVEVHRSLDVRLFISAEVACFDFFVGDNPLVEVPSRQSFLPSLFDEIILQVLDDGMSAFIAVH